LVGLGDVDAQAEQTFRNTHEMLRETDSSLARVIKWHSFAGKSSTRRRVSRNGHRSRSASDPLSALPVSAAKRIGAARAAMARGMSAMLDLSQLGRG
jgi:enamine deaminase RidA (YjgF/YER057c/UK114 family)